VARPHFRRSAAITESVSWVAQQARNLILELGDRTGGWRELLDRILSSGRDIYGSFWPSTRSTTTGIGLTRASGSNARTPTWRFPPRSSISLAGGSSEDIRSS
jgi:hypothetical protein